MAAFRRLFNCFETVRRPAGKTPASEMERRLYPREDCFTAVEYVVGNRIYKDFIQNISDGGVLIETCSPFFVGEEVSMTFRHPISQKNMRTYGEIACVGEKGIGVKFKIIAPSAEELGFREQVTDHKSSVGHKEVREMGRVKKKKVRWEASGSNDVLKYRLYWSRYGEVDYNSDHVELGNVTEVVLPEDVPSFPMIAGDIELGISAVSEAGNESDMTKLKSYFDFKVPDAPQNIEVEDI